MPSNDPGLRRLAARVAAAARWRRPDLAELTRDLAVLRLAHKIEDTTQNVDVSDADVVRLVDVALGRPADDEAVDDEW